MAVSAEVVICGAGIAGVAAAYHLAVMHGMKDVVLVEQDTPLSLTSDKSTECYRNWWPGPGDAMVALMNRSIDLLEEIARASDNRIQLNRRGYLYATADPSKIALLQHAGEEAARLGAGPLRVHRGLGTGDGGLGTTPLGPPAGGGTEGGGPQSPVPSPQSPMDAQRTSAQARGLFAGMLEERDLARVGRRIQVAAAVELDAVVAGARDLLQQIDAAVHERDHRIARAGPPVAVALGRFVAGQRERRVLLDQHNVFHAVHDGQVVCCGNSSDPSAADHNLGRYGHVLHSS